MLVTCPLISPFGFREQALKKRLALVHDSLNTALSDSSSNRRDNGEQIARLTQAHRWTPPAFIVVIDTINHISHWNWTCKWFYSWTVNVEHTKLHLDGFYYSLAVKRWVHTGRSAGSIGSRCGGWSRERRPWRRVSSRARHRNLQERPRSGGGKRPCCDPRVLPVQELLLSRFIHISSMWRTVLLSFRLPSALLRLGILKHAGSWQDFFCLSPLMVERNSWSGQKKESLNHLEVWFWHVLHPDEEFKRLYQYSHTTLILSSL